MKKKINKNIAGVTHTHTSDLKNKKGITLIIGFIIGAVLASGITVYAYSYHASDVSYTTGKNVDIGNVEQALNDLYSRTNQLNLKNTVVASKNYGETQNNPKVTAEYTFNKDGYAIVNLGTRSAGNFAGTTIYTIKINGETVKSYNASDWAFLDNWSGNVVAGQKISVYVENTASNAAAFALINFVDKE